MSTVNEVKAELEDVNALVLNVSSDVDSLLAQVAALKEQVANGGVASQADVDAIFAKVAGIKESLSGVDAKEPPVVPV